LGVKESFQKPFSDQLIWAGWPTVMADSTPCIFYHSQQRQHGLMWVGTYVLCSQELGTNNCLPGQPLIAIEARSCHMVATVYLDDPNKL